MILEHNGYIVNMNLGIGFYKNKTSNDKIRHKKRMDHYLMPPSSYIKLVLTFNDYSTSNYLGDFVNRK